MREEMQARGVREEVPEPQAGKEEPEREELPEPPSGSSDWTSKSDESKLSSESDLSAAHKVHRQHSVSVSQRNRGPSKAAYSDCQSGRGDSRGDRPAVVEARGVEEKPLARWTRKVINKALDLFETRTLNPNQVQISPPIRHIRRSTSSIL